MSRSYLDGNSPMPYGKHKGKRLEDVPTSYLLWLNDNGLSHVGLKRYIERNADALRDASQLEADGITKNYTPKE